MADLSWLPPTLLALDWVIRVLLAVHIIMRRRPLAVSFAWLTIVMMLPVVGLVLYLFVGENRLGSQRLAEYRRFTAGFFTHAIELWNERERSWIPMDHAQEHIARYGTQVCGLPPLTGNDLRLLSGCDDFFNALIADIDAARDHVHIQTYIWITRGAGVQVVEALERAASRGVTCRVLVDAVGARPFFKSSLPRRLRTAGVRVREALPAGLLRLAFRRLDLRNHRKIAVIDGRIGYCGSHNITDDSFGMKGRNPVGPWLDASMRVVGPAAQALQMVFLRDWAAEGREAIEDLRRLIPEFDGPIIGGAVAQVLPSGPGPEPGAIEQAMLTAIYGARRELILTTPYFVPSEAAASAMRAAAERGVRVSLVVPKRSDWFLVAAAGRAFYLDLLEAGVAIYAFRPALLHAKTLTVDGEIAMIGSANFDTRSFSLNFEATLFVYSDEAAGELRTIQQSYIDQSDRLDLDAWRARPKVRVFLDNAAQLLAPVL